MGRTSRGSASEPAWSAAVRLPNPRRTQPQNRLGKSTCTQPPRGPDGLTIADASLYFPARRGRPHQPRPVFSLRLFPGTLPRVVDRASMAPASRATGGTMSNRVCCVFVKLAVLSMMVFTVGVAGCSGGRGIRIGTTGGATSSTAGTTGMVTSGRTTGTTGGMTGTTGGTGGGGSTPTTSTGGVAGSSRTTNGSAAAATGGTDGVLSCAGVNCPALPASCKDIVQDPHACCPTCTNTGCDPCADITCASGTHLETPVGACCPQCVVDPVDPCTQGQRNYAALRATLLDKYATVGCNNSSDCVIAPENNLCVANCGNPLPSTMAANLEANLTTEANSDCATCATPIPPPCVSVVPACVNRKCVAANPS